MKAIGTFCTEVLVRPFGNTYRHHVLLSMMRYHNIPTTFAGYLLEFNYRTNSSLFSKILLKCKDDFWNSVLICFQMTYSWMLHYLQLSITPITVLNNIILVSAHNYIILWCAINYYLFKHKCFEITFND